MPALSTIALFCSAALALLLIPGPAMLYVITRGVDQGRRAGVVSSLGVGTGGLCHVLAATLGLSALLLSSSAAFSLVKYAGAAYLVYLGVRTLLARGQVERVGGRPPAPLLRLYSQGVLVEALNPKVALFFFAFLPQFVDPARGPVSGQVCLFGCLFVLLGICTDNLYALVAGTIAGRLKRTAPLVRSRRYIAGSIYIGLGLTTALTGSRRT